MTLCSLAVEGNLTIYDAVAQKQALLAALGEGDGLELDLSRVAEIDTAGLQLLLLLKREALRLQRPLRMVGHSQAVAEAIQFFNITAFLGDPLVLPGNTA